MREIQGEPTGRGSTHRGQTARLARSDYRAESDHIDTNDPELTVRFSGDDGRQAVFDFTDLPLPGWHHALAVSFRHRTGPAGGLRTRESAYTSWRSVVRWMRYLARVTGSPAHPGGLVAGHVTRYLDTTGAWRTRVSDIRELRQLFDNPHMRGLLRDAAWDAMCRRFPDTVHTSVARYSDGELTRVMAVLRKESAMVRDRIRAGEALLRRFRDTPQQLDPAQQRLGACLAEMAVTGVVPHTIDGHKVTQVARRELASHLFVVLDDLPPLLLLMAALSHRNGEPVKELPAAHTVLENRAVELEITKRRHGANHWFETVTWEIGPSGRELFYPGGMYLLLLELTARSRAWSGSHLALCLWRNGLTAKVEGVAEHYAPYASGLKGATLRLAEWAASRTPPLVADPSGTSKTSAVLPVTFNRIKTSMDVRRTRQLGGHLPSAAKSNTMQVLFRHYLSGDPTITDWATDVLNDAFDDAEQAALDAHRRTLNTAGGALQVVPGTATDPARPQAGDTAWTACSDISRHPVTGQACQSTFLDCFHCGNCVITPAHLPRLLGLVEALEERRERMNTDAWWQRYGPAWAAIRHDILTKFTPAGVDAAHHLKPAEVLLPMVENPWEAP